MHLIGIPLCTRAEFDWVWITDCSIFLNKRSQYQTLQNLLYSLL